MAKKLIVFLVFPGVNLIDLGGPMQAFATSQEYGKPSDGYEIIVASHHGGLMSTAPGMNIETVQASSLDVASIDTVIVPGGSRDGTPPQDRDLALWLRANAAEIPRICSVCTGAFILAESGLMSGRRMATHWRWAEDLQKRNPDIRVESDPIYIEDGKFWTSAGVTAGIDLSLHLISQDRGAVHAAKVARTLVVYLTRSGGQKQFSIPLEIQGDRDHAFSRVDDWIMANISRVIRLADLAEVAGMSERSFRRNYAATVGRTPTQTVDLIRLEVASQSLLSNKKNIKELARVVGCQSLSNLERLFKRHYNMSPSDYRDRFSKHRG